MLIRWLREPLLHFLFIGSLLFAYYKLQNAGGSDNVNRIIVTEAQVNRLAVSWEKKWQRPPTPGELNGLVEHQIREEVFYREALSMGLDQGDPIVRRRLAQKVEFISSDLAALTEPSDAQLVDYLAKHTERFAVPARISFEQIYFNYDKRSGRAREDSQRLLAKLKQPDTKVDIQMAGDRFMFGVTHKNLTEHGVSRMFGEQFAGHLFSLPVGTWQGPVSSGYGLHLVRNVDKIPGYQPGLEVIRDKVRDEWLEQQRRDTDKAFYQSLRKRYNIVVEKDLDEVATSVSKKLIFTEKQ